MSQIEKLKILGVRSFGIKGTGETINFDAPLTLIVGYNGSGKTTIIECLKYASMGQLPPNSKTGGAWIHDPKLAGEKEVMAQVKLQFRNATGNKMVITRSLSVSVKKAGVSQKTLECQLMMINRGERTSMSTRVGELDKIVPVSLGVSPAILESVIFCHQDESLWPMSEPTVLKKKFDNIFEAQKYTKAIDNLKILRKGKSDQMKLYQQEEEHAKALKDKSEKVQKRMVDLQNEIEALRDETETLQEEMDVADAISKEMHTQANKALGIVDGLKTKNERARNLQETLDTLGTSLQELQESDEWLQSTLEQYEDRMAQYKEQEEDFQAQYVELQQSIKDSRSELSEKQAEQGRLQAAKESYENQLQSRVDLVKEAARSHSMRGYDGDLDESQVHDFVQRVQKLSQDKDRELDRIQKATQDELNQNLASLNELGARRSTRTQEKVNARKAISSNDNKSRAKQQDADRIKMDEGTKASLEASHNDIQSRIQRLTSEYESAGWDANLKTENKHLQELDSESKRLRNELSESNKLAAGRAELDFTKDKSKQQQHSLHTMKSTYNDQLSALIGPDWQPENLEREFQVVLDQRTRALAEAKKQQQGLADELNDINSKIKTHRANLTKKKDDRQKCHAIVMHSITNSDGNPIASIDEYEPELESLKSELEGLQSDFLGKSHVSNYYMKALDTADKHNMCRLCRRPFAGTKEKVSVIDKINQEIAKYADDQLEKMIEEMRDSLKTADAARTQYDMYNALTKTEIPEIEREIRKNEEKKAPLNRRLEEQDNHVNEKETAKRDAESLSGNVNKIINYSAEISQYEGKIARLSSQQKLSGSYMSINEIDEQSAACDERIRIQNAKIKKLSNDKENAKSMITNLEREAGVVLNNLNSAKYEMDKKQGLLDTIEELRENTSQQREIIRQADSELESLVPQVSKAEAQVEDTRKRGQAKEKDVRADKEKLANTVNKFRLIEKAIDIYVESGGPGKLKACQRAIKDLEQDQQGMESDLKSVTTKANVLKKRINDSDQTKRSIIDNINYRKTRQQLQDAKREIAELDTRNVQDDYDELAHAAKAADEKYEIAKAKRGLVIGAMGSKDQELSKYNEEWDVDYNDAAQNYRKSHIMVETTRAAIEDLGKFAKALDSAIMQYHTLKMQEINTIAGELWRSTYQGTDVDTIMIRSDNENAASKRNYNYRVVMVKQDAEMDMRGRCSAGQKVLASIIIRLALAECFGINCGVIALDEPTTNLDRDNIKSLAESLNTIIKNRRHQSNFQLIIITHDEEFLRDMKCSEFTDNYYRVARDADQKSTIERQSLADFM